MAQSEESMEMGPRSSPLFTFVKKYEEEYTRNVMNGDVFIVQCDNKIQNAGVYLDGQIIQLKKNSDNSTEVIEVNVDGFTGGNRFAVYRKEGGIPQSFMENVNKAMSSCSGNDLSSYNCIEFVVELLGVNLKPTEPDCMKIAKGSKPKGFKVVKKFSDDYNDNAMPGDLLIVQNGMFGLGYLHAGVCCREKGLEIIQFASNGGGSSSFSAIGASSSSFCPGVVNKVFSAIWPSSSSFCPGVVTKVHVNGFSAGRKFAIYRSKMKIPESFQEKVDEAMSKVPQYHLSKYNCVHFALELLFGKLEKTGEDVENWFES